MSTSYKTASVARQASVYQSTDPNAQIGNNKIAIIMALGVATLALILILR
jgi:hypothetical protein